MRQGCEPTRRSPAAYQSTTPARLQDIVEDYERVLHALRAATAPDWLHVDLTMVQLRALLALSGDEPVSVGCLAAALGVSLPAASLLVERLVHQGLVERREDPRDRRRTLLSLSPAGRQLLTRLRHGNRERLHAWIARLDEEDRAALARGLRALAEVAASDQRAGTPGTS